MPVNSTHPEYDADAAAWQRARDVLAGEDAVKAAGECYLPKLEAQTNDAYKAYVSRYATEDILNWRLERINGRNGANGSSRRRGKQMKVAPPLI